MRRVGRRTVCARRRGTFTASVPAPGRALAPNKARGGAEAAAQDAEAARHDRVAENAPDGQLAQEIREQTDRGAPLERSTR